MYSLISQSYLFFNPTTSRLSATVNFQPDLSMFYDKSLQHSPTILGEIESELFIIPDNIVQELPAAIVPPEQIKQCDLLDDFDDFISANPSENPSPFPDEAFRTTFLHCRKLCEVQTKKTGK